MDKFCKSETTPPGKDRSSHPPGLKPQTHIVRNLHASELRLDVQIAYGDLQYLFQHAEYFTCNPLITLPIVIGLSNGFHIYSQIFMSFNLNTHML